MTDLIDYCLVKLLILQLKMKFRVIICTYLMKHQTSNVIVMVDLKEKKTLQQSGKLFKF